MFKALEDDLLTALSLAIYTEHPVTLADLLLETYEFKFSFSPTQVSINGVVISNKEDIKKQAAKFVRNLISFTQTLDNLPEKNWITMQMKVDNLVFIFIHLYIRCILSTICSICSISKRDDLMMTHPSLTGTSSLTSSLS